MARPRIVLAGAGTGRRGPEGPVGPAGAGADVTAAEIQAAKVAAEQAATDAEAAKVAVEAVEATNDGIMASVAADPESAFAGTLSETIASVAVPKEKVGGLSPAPLANPTFTPNTGPRVLDVFGGYTWGYLTSGDIYRQPVAGGAWALYTAATPADVGTIIRLIPTSDGEVLLASSAKVYKSSNWATPGSVTWTQVLAINAPTSILRWGFDGDATKFIATSYAAGDNFAASRYVYISTDAGDTFTLVYDSVAVHGAALADLSHVHGVTYDPWGDRFYLSEGHGTIGGIYCSDDDGATWSRAVGMAANPSPTTLTPTPDGLVCGSDNSENGLYGVVRRDDHTTEELVQTWAWRTGVDGLIGYGMRGVYDPTTGLVYVTFISNFSSVRPIIAAGTPTSGGLVYTWDDPNSWQLENIVMPTPGKIMAIAQKLDSSFHDFTATTARPGALRDLDRGNTKGGVVAQGTSVAVGPGATSGTAPGAVVVGVGATGVGASPLVSIGLNAHGDANSVVIGPNADGVGGGRSVAIGIAASSKVSFGVAIGNNAINSSAYSTAVGADSQSGSGGLAIGSSANANTGSSGTAVGHGTSAGASGVAVGHAAAAVAAGTAVGKSASVTQANSVAIGLTASATHLRSVALGSETATTANDQVQLNTRHVEMAEIAADPAAPAANKGRWYFKDNGSGKTQLCVRFNTGVVQILATEP